MVKETFRKVTVRELDGWLTRNNWFMLSLIERDDGSWDMEAISPSGRIIGFGSDKGELLEHWAPIPQQVEVINDEEKPAIAKVEITSFP